MMSCALIFWQLRMTFYLYTCKCQVNEKSGSHQPSQEINQVMCIDPGLEGSQYTCFVYIFYCLWDSCSGATGNCHRYGGWADSSEYTKTYIVTYTYIHVFI